MLVAQVGFMLPVHVLYKCRIYFVSIGNLFRSELSQNRVFIFFSEISSFTKVFVDRKIFRLYGIWLPWLQRFRSLKCHSLPWFIKEIAACPVLTKKRK